MSPRTIATLGAALLVSASAQAQTTFFDYTLTGGQEVPANDTLAFGFATLTYDASAETFDLELFTDGIELDDLMGVGPNSTPIHIHNAPAGSNGGIAIDIGTLASFQDLGGGILSFSVFDVPIGGFEDELFSGGLYTNIHTSNFPGGELRGQIVPGPTGTLVAVPGLLLAARRRRR